MSKKIYTWQDKNLLIIMPVHNFFGTTSAQTTADLLDLLATKAQHPASEGISRTF